MIEKGLLNFIRQKLDNSVDPAIIKSTLMRAGFPENRIDGAFEFVRKTDIEAHQKAAADNGFLPPLNKGQRKDQSIPVPSPAYSASVSAAAQDVAQKQYPQHAQKGLFQGRLLRRDFILGFLFFFGLGYIILVLAGVFLSSLFPELWANILAASADDTEGLLLLVIPLVLLPITVMLFSLITRRLHNLALPGGLSFVFLILCVSPAGKLSFYGLWIMYAMVLVLFVLLLTKKGDSAPNEYGPYPSSRGSFFKRIFNV